MKLKLKMTYFQYALTAMLHRRKDSTLSIEELKQIIQQNND